MGTPRSEFVEKLLLAAPALASNDLVPVLACFWFSGDSVVAFNDMIGVRVPCRTDFAGAVAGGTLLSLLKASRAREVEMLAPNGASELQVKAAGARLKLPLFPVDSFVFEMPKMKTKDALPLDGSAFISAVEACLRSVSTDTSVPDQLGVTVVPGKGELILYATNNATVTRARVPTKKDGAFRSRVILSGQFCEQVVRLAGKSSDIVLELADDHVLLAAPGGVTLYGRLVEVDKPLDFEGIVGHHVPKGYEKRVCPVPARLPAALDRAVIVADAKTGMAPTTVSVKEGRMRLVTKSERGDVTDGFAAGDHEDASIGVNAKILRSALDHYDKILVTEGCVVFEKVGVTHLVAAVDS